MFWYINVIMRAIDLVKIDGCFKVKYCLYCNIGTYWGNMGTYSSRFYIYSDMPLLKTKIMIWIKCIYCLIMANN